MGKQAWAALGVAALTAGCAPSLEEGELLQQAIVGGEPSDAGQDGVLLLRGVLDENTELICTVSLVAPNLVLTARHCVSYLSEGLFSCNTRGELEPSDAEGGRLGLHRPAEELEFYGGDTPRSEPVAKGRQVFSTLSPTICTNDIAFVLLDTSLTLPLVPLRLDAPAEVGEAAVLVGFGMNEDEAGIDYRTQPRLQRRNLRVAAVGPSNLANGVTTAPPRSLLLRGPSGCIGDSGGPLLAQTSGALLGVYSLIAGESCAGANALQQLVQVQPFTALINEAFEAAGAEPLPEPPPSANGGEAGQPTTTPEPTEAGAGGAPAEPHTPAPKSSGCALAGARDHGNSTWPLAVLLCALRRRRQG